MGRINPENIRLDIFRATPLITHNVYHQIIIAPWVLGIKITGFLHYTSRIYSRVNNARAHTSIGIIEARGHRQWRPGRRSRSSRRRSKQVAGRDSERGARCTRARAHLFSIHGAASQFNQNNRAKLMAARRLDKLPERRLHFHTCVVGDCKFLPPIEM
jgi:hypothetical protein